MPYQLEGEEITHRALLEALLDYIDADEPRDVLVCERHRPIGWLLQRLMTSTDPLPAWACGELRLPEDASYGDAVVRIKSQMEAAA